MREYLKDYVGWMWRYRDCPKGYWGLHMTMLPASCGLMRRLCGELRLHDVRNSHRAFPLRPLNQRCAEAVAWGTGQSLVCYEKGRIMLVEPREDVPDMRWSIINTEVTLQFTPDKLAEFVDVVGEIEKDIGDAAMHPDTGSPHEQDKGCLWYWPCMGHERVRYRPKPEDWVVPLPRW